MNARLASICVRALLDRIATSRTLWVLDGDLADSYDAQLFEAAAPDRFVMCGIAEQNMVSMAAGLAASGQRPWVFSFAAFLVHRANDQVRVSVAQSALPVTLVGSHAGGCGGRNGKTHQTTNDLAVLGTFPGIRLYTPGDPADVDSVVEAVMAETTPAYVRMPRDPCGPLPGSPQPARWLTEPAEHVVLTHGLSSHWVMEALGAAPKDLGVLHLNRLWPLSEDVLGIVRDARTWSVVEDHIWQGGLASRLTEATRTIPRCWMGWPQAWAGGSGASEELRRSQGLDPDRIRHGLFSELD